MKTFLNLNHKLSLIIVSIIGIVFAFLSNAYYVNGLINLALYVIRIIIFTLIFLFFYLFEKKDLEFKEFNKRGIGYLVINGTFNIICTIFVSTNLLRELFVTLSGIICLGLIICFILEIIKMYSQNKFIEKCFKVTSGISENVGNFFVKLVSERKG